MASNDHISREQEESMAKQIKATTIILPARHAVMLSHPKVERQASTHICSNSRRTDAATH